MRCYACNEPANFHDTPTNRMYCSTCWNIIEAQIAGVTQLEEEIGLEVPMDEEEEYVEDSSEDASEVSSMWP